MKNPAGGRRRIAILVAIVAVLGVPETGAAADIAPSDTLRLQSLIEETIAAHPDAARARMLHAASEERVSSAGALENPMLEFALDDQPVEGGGAGKRQIGLSQAVSFPGTRGARTQAALGEAEAAGETARGVERAVVTEVKIAYWTLFELDHRAAILRESRSTVGDVIAAARTRYETGLGNEQEFLLARIEAGKLDGEIRHVDALAAAARSKINLLAGRPVDAPVGRAIAESPTPFTETLEELLALAREDRPSVRSAAGEVDAATAELRVARAAWRPDLVFGAMYSNVPDAVDEWRASLGFALPVWKGRKENAASREAERRLDAASRSLDGARLRASIAVEEQYAHVVSEREIVELYRRDILPQAELASRGARAGYLAGRETFLVLLESLRNHLELRSIYFETFADAEMHLAWLEEAVGRDLRAVGGVR